MKSVEFDHNQWIYEEVIISSISAQNELLNPVEIYDCEIHHAQLSAATLRRWVFENCIFKDCDLSNVIFDQCIFQNSLFDGCRLIGSNWSRSTQMNLHVQFINSNLSLSNFTQVDCSKVIFKNSMCMNVDFSGSKLMDSVFTNTSIKGSIFEETDLSGADLVGALEDPFDLHHTRLKGATISLTTAIRLIESQGIKVQAVTK